MTETYNYEYCCGARSTGKMLETLKRAISIVEKTVEEEKALTEKLVKAVKKARENGTAIFEHKGEKYLLQSNEHNLTLYPLPIINTESLDKKS